MDKEFRILMLEDDPADAELEELELKKSGLVFTLKVVDTREVFLKELDEFSPDLILSDYDIPSFDGLAALRLAKEKRPDVPFILVAGTIGEEIAVESIKEGATDYVLKTHLKRLVPSVNRALEEAKMIAECKRSENALRESDRTLRSIVGNSSDEIFMLDKSLKYLFVNKPLANTLGKVPEEIIGKSIHEVYAPEIAVQFSNNIHKIFETAKSLFIEEKMTAQGQEFFISTRLNPVLDNMGRVRAVTGIVRDITERKQAEETIKRLHHQNELILNAAGEGIFGLDIHGNHTFMNPSAAQMLGYTVDELIGINSHTTCHYKKADGSPYPAEECPIYEAYKDGGVHRIEEDIFWRKDGTSFPVAYSSTPIIENGQNIGAVVTFRNITESRKAEKALRESEDKFRSLFNQAADLIAIIDLQGNFIDMNRKYEEESLWSREEMIGRNVLTSGIVTEESARKISFYLSQLVQGKEIPIFEVDGVRKDGGIVPYELKATPIRKDDNTVSIQAILRNITERKKTEKALQESEAKFRNLFNGASDAIFIHDLKGHFLEVNEIACKRLGYSREELLRMTAMDIDTEEYAPLVAERIKQKLTQGHNVFETSHKRKDGTVIMVEISSRTIDFAGIPAALSIARDISERKKLEAQLMIAQKMEAVGVLAGGIAHDFNNLLQSIIMGTAIAKTRSHEENVREILMQVENECLKAEELSNLLITFSKGGTPVAQKSSITDVLKETVLSVLKDSPANTEFALPDNLWPVAIDEGQIRIAITQLVMNAKEAMPSGGVLKVQARNIESIAKENVPLEEGKYIKVTFADSGAGISPENLSKIFDPYFTTKQMGSQKGRGLSLTVSQSIVKKHRGIITAESKPGTGTTFHIYLPAALP